MVNPFASSAPNHEFRGEDDRRWEMGFRLDIPEFTDSLDASEFLDWLNSVEELLDFKGVPDQRRVPLVATRFRWRASAWWQQAKLTRIRHSKTPISTWAKFRKHMEREFLPFNYARTLYQRLQNLRQGTKSVDTYTEEFYHLLARVDIQDSVDQLVSRYIGGLRLQFQDTLNLFVPASVSEAHQRAIASGMLFARILPSRPNGCMPFTLGSSLEI
ncbi:hypothetical protein DH2020_039313 [Rehmannia glutinosa]|uniref:Retrotransposon gag domain-containing protein n=1 Tax=Rehmannia glutinosa TaxID=99300 RepID=A0ABR0UXC0_REHGL